MNSTFQCYKILIWPTCVILHFLPKGMKYGQTKVTSFFALIKWATCCITSLVNQNLYPYIIFVSFLPLYNLLWLIIFTRSLLIVFLLESNVFSPNALSLTIIAYVIDSATFVSHPHLWQISCHNSIWEFLHPPFAHFDYSKIIGILHFILFCFPSPSLFLPLPSFDPWQTCILLVT